jgi:hypothetical protein
VKRAILLFACFFATYGAFVQEPGVNESSRLALGLAIARHRTFAIEQVMSETPASTTCDWSSKDGHLYSNKAPGLSVLAAPLLALLEGAERTLSVDPCGSAAYTANAWGVNLVFNASLVALAAVVFGGVASSLARSDVHESASVALGLGTLLFPYATAFYSHAGSAALLFLSFAVARAELAGRARPLRLVGAGLLAGLAGASEYSVGIPAVLLAAYVLWVSRSWRAAAAFSAGGAPPLAGFMLYHWACFGSPFVTALAYTNPIMLNASGGLFGAPSTAALWGVTFSPYRGLFVYCPVLLVAIAGLASLARRTGRAEAILVAVIFLYFLLLNACFTEWHAGASHGPRYMIASIPFVALGLAEALVRWRRLTLALVAVGAASSVAVAATSVSTTSREDRFPLRDLAFSPLLSGDYGPRACWRPGPHLLLLVVPAALWIAFARTITPTPERAVA